MVTEPTNAYLQSYIYPSNSYIIHADIFSKSESTNSPSNNKIIVVASSNQWVQKRTGKNGASIHTIHNGTKFT